MKSLILTWPRRLIVTVVTVLLVTSALLIRARYYPNEMDVWSIGENMKRFVALPFLVGIVVLSFTTAWSGSTARAAELGGMTPATTASKKPFVAQVVGLEWMNPLQRRDYPTEWQLLWTLGLVKPNKNDDMVRTDSKSFTTIQPVAGIANGVHGRETFQGFYEKYIDKLLILFGTKYVINQNYFYTVQSPNKKRWKELAGIHVELAIPTRLNPESAGHYLAEEITSEFNIGNPNFKDLWSKDTPPDVRVHVGGANAGFTSLNAALDYLQTHPQESVWVMNWDAPSFPPKDQQINENMTLLFLAGPDLKTEREPLAWIGRTAMGNVSDYEAKVGTTRAVQAWKATIAQAAQNANVDSASLQFVVHDAGKGSEAASTRLVSLSQTLTETLPEFDYGKQMFNTPALLGDMGAGTALTDIALAIGRINHFGGNALVAGTTDPNHPTAVVILPPSKLTAIDPEQDWFRARGEDNAYLPWWGRRYDTNYRMQGYSY